MFSGDSANTPQVIARTDDFAALCKPPGLETVSESGERDFLGLVRETLGARTVIPVHRLDRDTSGVQLFALSAGAESELSRLFRERMMTKHYVALCLGAPANRRGTINRNLSKWEGGRRPVRVVKGGGGFAASTGYAVAAQSAPGAAPYTLSLIDFFPHQGRTHQIRVHAAALGYPVLGDDQYGDRAANKWAKNAWGLRRQALHAEELSFEWRGEQIQLTCGMPNDMEHVAATAFPPGQG